MIVQFFGINIDITIELPACLYITLCSKIAAKINGHLIQTLLNAESEINIMNCKVVEIYDISICCEVTLKMRTADSEKVPFYNCAENVEMNMTDVIFILSIFVAEGVENELIFEHLWEWVIEANTFNQADGFVE